jgi:2-polyprenyl-6-hydroxyphenyl methylase/3-demethylubiquinone-9 3-methyltransferase
MEDGSTNSAEEDRVNNELYFSMGEKWYHGDDHPVALLRQESKIKVDWILDLLEARGQTPKSTKILDIGCGAGFAANALALNGYALTGLDCAADALAVATKYDSTQSVSYVQGDALSLPFADNEYDVVISLDFLEHVDQPTLAVREAGRVLRPGGIYIFHTFNRNPLARLVVIKGVEWFVKYNPHHLQVYSLFIKPSELANICVAVGMSPVAWSGLRPQLNGAMLQMLWTGRVPADFAFRRTKSLGISYMGAAEKNRGEQT